MTVALFVALSVLVACGGSDGDSTTSPSESASTDQVDPHDHGDDHDHGDHDHQGAIVSEASAAIEPSFDLVQASVIVDGGDLIFRSTVVAEAGDAVPEAAGALDQAPVWSYVWPTSLDSSAVGFESAQGILALAVTSHPDFDDTPLYDEDGDGDAANDGAQWHAHWVVLEEQADCAGGLGVKGIAEGATPTLPETWPGLPILIDSPDLTPDFGDDVVQIRVPLSAIGAPDTFNYDGVTSGLRVSTSPHDPLLCVEIVFDVASGDLSLPGVVRQ